jgi:hypothetical protein
MRAGRRERKRSRRAKSFVWIVLIGTAVMSPLQSSRTAEKIQTGRVYF